MKKIPENKNTSATLAVQTEITIPSYKVPVKFTLSDQKLISEMFENKSDLADCRLLVEYRRLGVQGGYNELLCLKELKNIEKYWYQIETVKKTLKYFHGRVLLADEVGLGKTIEAGMLIKEYLLRKMVKNILILAPSSLVSQWKEEMHQKFGLKFITTDDDIFQADPDKFWNNKFIIASINTAKSGRNFKKIVAKFYDLVVVDEGHHLKNRKTAAWKLVNEIKKRFIFILTATPLQNNLIELFNLITLLKPGQFKTEKLFRQEYMRKKNESSLDKKEKLKSLLRDIMIRNTRSVIDLKLPKRFASTIRVEPADAEKQIYDYISTVSRDLSPSLPANTIRLLIREAGSSPFALKDTLIKLKPLIGDTANHILELIDKTKDIGKGKSLIELLQKNPQEKKVIFTQYLKSMDYCISLLSKHGIPFAEFRGNMTAEEKDAAINNFRENIPVLISTELGGEGRNLQFANTLINFDLPWNPMRIEQRIGRIHRIGQTRDVFIFNLSVKNTLEDYMINILENKINMFEMVIGEVEPILGYLGEDKEFENIILDIWLKNSDQKTINKNFEDFGSKLVKAKSEYLKSAALDKEVFGEDYEV
ncbi:MAG: SNF2-related protein [Patescibacteria group bacterium]